MTVTEADFGSSADELFATLTNPVTYPEWLVGTKVIREVSPDWPARGSYFKHAVGFGPLAVRDRTTLRDIDRPHMLELFVRARPLIEAAVRFEIVDTAGGRTRLRMTESPVGVFKLFAPVLQPLIRARNERSLRRLRACLDGVTEDPQPSDRSM